MGDAQIASIGTAWQGLTHCLSVNWAADVGDLVEFASMVIPIGAYCDYDAAGLQPMKSPNLPQGTQFPRFPLIPASELTAHPVKIHWLLYNFIEVASLNLLFGEPGAAKSLIALEWAFCIALGLEWRGFITKKTDVVIVTGEGFSGFARRLKALEIKYNVKSPDNMLVSQRPAQLLDRGSAKLVAESVKAACPNPGLVIIDTMHRNTAIDENSSQDVGRFINNLDDFLKPLGAAVLIVHHSGHNDKGRSRGSSAIRGALDAEFSAAKNDDFITLSCLKSKDFEKSLPINFKLKVTDLGWFDDYGDPVTSVYLEAINEAGSIHPNTKLTKLDSAILKTLDEAIGQEGIELPESIKLQFGIDPLAGLLAATIGSWQDLAFRLPVMAEKKKNARRMAFTRTKTKLIDCKFVVESYGYVWLDINES